VGEGEVRFGAAPVYESDLDSLPPPARHLVDSSAYFYVLGTRATFTTVMSSRGCPYRCTFCSTPRGGFRARSVSNVVDEMKRCMAAGAEEIHFVDDTFNLESARLAELSREIVRRGLRTRWSFRGRADGVSREALELAARAGCIRFHLGVETGTDEGLKALRKGVTVAEVEEAVRLARRAGIVTAAYFIIGCPHEKSRADVERTLDFAVRLDPDFALFNILAVYPGTELFTRAVEKGVLAPDLWSSFARHPGSDFVLPFWVEHLSHRELDSLLKLAYRRFYLRPALVWRNLRSLGSLNELVRKAQAALSILLGRG